MAVFSLEGISYSFDPILVSAGVNDAIDFDDGGGEENATITAKLYKDPIELAAEIQSKMDALTADTITCSYSSTTGKFTIASDGVTFSLLWNTGTNTATTIGSDLGFTIADGTGAVTYTSDSAIDLSSFDTATFDSSDPLVAKNNQVMIGTFSDYTCFEASSLTFTLTNTKTDILSVCAESGKAGSLINQREVTLEVTALLDQYEAQNFKRFRSGDEISFQYNFGTKSGNNWVAGKCGNIYMPTATISEFSLGDEDGLVTLNMTITAYVSSGAGEVYLNFV
jgi:hypothetical protein